MADQDLDLTVLHQSVNGPAQRLPIDEAGTDDCIPCEERRRIRAALVEMRRGIVSLERGLAALLAAVDRTGRE